MRECWLHQERETLEFSSTNLWIWFLRWQQCANPHSIISVKLGSFVNISPLMQPRFLFKLLLHRSLTTVIRYCMVYLRAWLNSSNVCRTQLLVLLLSLPSSVIFTPVLANLHWLSIYLRIELKILIVICKTFHGHDPTYIEDLLQCYLPVRDLRSSKKKIYLSCLLLTVMAVELFPLLRRFFGTVFLSILGMLDHKTVENNFFLDAAF